MTENTTSVGFEPGFYASGTKRMTAKPHGQSHRGLASTVKLAGDWTLDIRPKYFQ